MIFAWRGRNVAPMVNKLVDEFLQSSAEKYIFILEYILLIGKVNINREKTDNILFIKLVIKEQWKYSSGCMGCR
jgi:hypothetical protein